MAVIFGTSHRDIINSAGVSPGVTGGVPGDDADSIFGNSGVDVVNGAGGDDFIKGQDGSDTLRGGPGDDHLGGGRSGGFLGDYLGGGAGDDRLRGHTGDDELFGGTGDDWLEGHSGNDDLFGGAGNDLIQGHADNDLIRGGAGDDRLEGDAPLTAADHVAGDDDLDGEEGNDRLIGYGGFDDYFGGAGNDTIVIHDVEFHEVDGGAGADKLKVVTPSFDLDFTGDLSGRVSGFETLDLRGGDHTVIMNPGSLLALGSETGKLKVNGASSDSIELSSEFAAAGEQVRGATTYNVFASARGAEVWVKDDVSVTIDPPVPTPNQPGLVELSSLDGTNGFVINGIDAGDGSGISVSDAGDVNGDGFDDLIIGAFGAGPNGDVSGESYVLFGSDDGFDATLELSSLNGDNGFVIEGIEADDESGTSVHGAGDINGDGFDDLVVGALNFGDFFYSYGESYVVFGSGDGFDARVELSALDGSNGFTMTFGGTAVSGGGDINGDGFDDVIIGLVDSFWATGRTFVVFGSDSAFPAILPSVNGRNGFELLGISAYDNMGESVSHAGDVNGDGYDDLIIGAPGRNYDPFVAANESYVVFGSGEGFDAAIEVSTLDGSNGFVIEGIDVYDYSGIAVGGAGDVNGDGFDDLIVGAFTADPRGVSNAGESYIVFGSSDPFGAVIELADLDGGNGFVLNGINPDDRSGGSVSGAGDVNGDGYDDLIIGASGADTGGDGSGESYVVFGSGDPFAASIDLADLDGSNGFRINGVFRGDYAGVSVSGTGDVDGDGYDDLIIGASGADPGGNVSSGQSYVVFGAADIGGGGAVTADLGTDTDPLLL